MKIRPWHLLAAFVAGIILQSAVQLVGRDVADARLALAAKEVARQHCRSLP